MAPRRSIAVLAFAAVALAGARAQAVPAGIIRTVVRGLVSPTGIALDSDGSLVVAETGAHRVRRLAPATGALTLLAGTGAPGATGDGNTATLAQLFAPWGVAVGRSREIYIADFGNNRVRVIRAGVITTLLGTGVEGSGGDGGPPELAQVLGPRDVAVDSQGAVFVSSGDGRVRRVYGGLVSTLITVPVSSMRAVYSMTVDTRDIVLVGDDFSRTVYRVDPRSGVVARLAGGGTAPPDAGGPAGTVALRVPSGLATDNAGTLYVASLASNQVYAVDRWGGGMLSLVAGSGEDGAAAGTGGYTGDGGEATAAQLNAPCGLVSDASGARLFFVDKANGAVRVVGLTPPEGGMPTRTGTPTRTRTRSGSRGASRSRTSTASRTRKPTASRTRSRSRKPKRLRG